MEQRLFFGALTLCVSLFGVYVYLIGASVVHVVARKEVDQEITALRSRAGELESVYLELGETISAEAISRLGFVAAPSQKTYIAAAPTNLALANDGR